MRHKQSLLTILTVIIGVAGLALLLYPTVSDWWNSTHQRRTVTDYTTLVAELESTRHDEVFSAAEAYNRRLCESGILWDMDDEQQAEYTGLLNIDGSGVMGYISIPKINVTLPIYHGTSDKVLQFAVGHLSGTSLPVGGKGTHCSVSGHRGLPSARLFTDLDKLGIGDTWTVTVLDRAMTYKVDQIHVVLPSDMEDLEIDPEQDYFTLITCTPYGVNSHRLLVRGHRIENEADTVTASADAAQVSSARPAQTPEDREKGQ